MSEQQYEKFSFEYINKSYGLGAYVGRKIKFDGYPGVITGAKGHYLLIRLDGGDRELVVHPEWKMKYL